MNYATWFHENGIGAFPLKWRSKEPACKWKDYRCTPEAASGFTNYGVRLGQCRDGWLMVVDTDNYVDEAWAEVNLPPTPFIVTTGRGKHRYYRSNGPLPKFIRRDGHVIEGRNQGQYVVGPGSDHPLGAVYTPSDWSWRWSEITLLPADFIFDDGSCGRISAPRDGVRGPAGVPYEFPDVVHKNERHHELFKLLRSFKGLGIDRATTREVIHLANSNSCHPPLAEDEQFEDWFDRGWDQPDRPLVQVGELSGLRGLR